jgi:two-component system, cell cycle response regulator
MPAKILSVDDSKTIRMIVKRTFATYEATVLEAANGEEGLAAAAENPNSSSSTSPGR